MILTTYNYRLIVCLPSASCVVIVSILFNPLKILTDKPALINGGGASLAVEPEMFELISKYSVHVVKNILKDGNSRRRHDWGTSSRLWSVHKERSAGAVVEEHSHSPGGRV